MKRLESFFFAPMTATGFGLLRSFWAFTALLFMFFQWSDVIFYYSDVGIFPQELSHLQTRSVFRFTLLESITDPQAVFALYLLLLLALTCMMVGLYPRFMTIASVLLLFSFHEGNPLPLGGGDTLLRNTGFILMLAPNLSAFSLHRLEKQWNHWKKRGSLLRSATMPIWPWRLLLWQLSMLYLASLWYKTLGTMWGTGTAPIAAFHHPQFARVPLEWMHLLAPLSPLIAYATLFDHIGWIMLVLPPQLRRILPAWTSRIRLKRILIIFGLFFHGSILLFMDAGSFSMAVFAVYIGFLRKDDFDWLKKVLRAKPRKKIAVLYDGHCGFCLRSVFGLQILDHLSKIKFISFWDKVAKEKIAPDLKIKDLDRAMHVRSPSGKTYKGFYAFRRLSWSLPSLWLMAPLLYVPGVPLVGCRIYSKVAQRRKRCSHKRCQLF